MFTIAVQIVSGEQHSPYAQLVQLVRKSFDKHDVY